jgi:hypothetical protein
MTDLADLRPTPSLNALTAGERYCPRRHAALLLASRFNGCMHTTVTGIVLATAAHCSP